METASADENMKRKKKHSQKRPIAPTKNANRSWAIGDEWKAVARNRSSAFIDFSIEGGGGLHPIISISISISVG